MAEVHEPQSVLTASIFSRLVVNACAVAQELFHLKPCRGGQPFLVVSFTVSCFFVGLLFVPVPRFPLFSTFLRGVLAFYVAMVRFLGDHQMIRDDQSIEINPPYSTKRFGLAPSHRRRFRSDGL